MEVECWDRDTDARLGRATRGIEDGLFERSRGGFALKLQADRRQVTVLCKRPLPWTGQADGPGLGRRAI